MFVCVYSVFVLSCVQVAALRLADHSSKESYRLYKKDYETEEEARAQQRAVEPLMNKNEVENLKKEITEAERYQVLVLSVVPYRHIIILSDLLGSTSK
jgi:hypothetical protein